MDTDESLTIMLPMPGHAGRVTHSCRRRRAAEMDSLTRAALITLSRLFLIPQLTRQLTAVYRLQAVCRGLLTPMKASQPTSLGQLRGDVTLRENEVWEHK